MKTFINTLWLLGFLSVISSSAVGSASADDSYQISLGLHLENFDYTEFDTDNSVLNNESGNLPGVSLAIERHNNNWVQGINFALLNGNVTYDGQTQTGIPLTSVSDALVLDAYFYIGRHWRGQEKYATLLYAGLGYHYWRRNIRPSVIVSTGQPVAGLLEHYQWWYALIGYNWTYKLSARLGWGVDIQARRMLSGTMEVDFLGFNNYDNATVNLGERWGSRFALPVQYELSRESALVIEPYLSYWDIGRSNVVPITVNGVPTGSGAVEPRSETRDHGLAVYYRQAF